MGLKKFPKTLNDLTGYVVYQPDNYDKNKKYPVIILIHGQGERGDGSDTDPQTGINILYKFVDNVYNNFWVGFNTQKFVFVAPQLALGQNWSSNYVTDALRFARQYSIDEDRKILMTISLGGQMGWPVPAQSNEFAGVVNICPVWVQANFCNIKTPVWTFHAKNDPVVNYSGSKSATDAINVCNPPVRAKLTTLEKNYHEIWGEVLSPVLLPGETQTAWQWMEQQKRNSIAPVPLPVPPVDPVNALNADPSATLTSVAGTRAVLNGTRSTGYTKGIPWDYMSWRVVSQPAGSTYDIWDMPNSGKIGDIINLKNLVVGKYKFEVIVKDAANNKDTAEVELTVTTSGKQQVGTGTANGQPAILYSDKTWS